MLSRCDSLILILTSISFVCFSVGFMRFGYQLTIWLPQVCKVGQKANLPLEGLSVATYSLWHY
jgi:hypothetical protein